MKTKIFVLLLTLCLLFSVSAVASFAMEARDGEVGDQNGVVTDATTAATTTAAATTTTAALTTTRTPTTTAPTTTAPITTAAVTTGAADMDDGGSVWAVILGIIAAAAIVTLVVVLVPKMRR